MSAGGDPGMEALADELKALKQIVGQLEGLSAETQQRILRAVAIFYGIEK